MQFSPSLHKSPLPPRQVTGKQIDGLYAENRNVLLIVCMEVRRMVRAADLHVHSNYNSKEAAELWHVAALYVHRFLSSIR